MLTQCNEVWQVGQSGEKWLWEISLWLHNWFRFYGCPNNMTFNFFRKTQSSVTACMHHSEAEWIGWGLSCVCVQEVRNGSKVAVAENFDNIKWWNTGIWARFVNLHTLINFTKFGVDWCRTFGFGEGLYVCFLISKQRASKIIHLVCYKFAQLYVYSWS